MSRIKLSNPVDTFAFTFLSVLHKSQPIIHTARPTVTGLDGSFPPFLIGQFSSFAFPASIPSRHVSNTAILFFGYRIFVMSFRIA